MNNFRFLILFLALPVMMTAQDIRNNPTSNHGNKFEQLGTILPTPNEYRTASGAPGPKYWQQRADYKIKATLDEKNLTLKGEETVTYFNNSPDELTYLWFQLDENEHDPTVNSVTFDASRMRPVMPANAADVFDKRKMLEGLGLKIDFIRDAANKSLPYTINQTMMRVDLPSPLKPGQQFVLHIGWHYKISDRMKAGGRGGYEYFPAEDNYLFTMAQWYPRLCVYSDFQGWQNLQFTGRGEFALTFGNFEVEMTVPADHILGATGECQNYSQVLTATQLARWKQAQASKDIIEIVNLEEARKAESTKSSATKTWKYKAEMVRDFAWTSSRKFVWDAMPVTVEGKKIMAMSYYPKESYNTYRTFSTKAVAHTIKTYSQFSIPYPYPVAISVEAANGMEYPMICFNYGRDEADGTYTEATKYGAIGVIIHEVGHNFFPMIVNSDERQWTWMDEGLNTFLQYITEEHWDNKYPSRRGPAWAITDYMRLPKDQLEPIMTNSENIVQFGHNAYAKPATGLNILRETIMGRELFDFAFKEYSRRWAFKHPTPADFFRTMEDASAVDLDWFWRGWFYGIEPVDIALSDVQVYRSGDLVNFRGGRGGANDTFRIARPMLTPDDISKLRNREDTSIHFATDLDPQLRDFYWKYARGLVTIDSTPHVANRQPMETPTQDDETRALQDKWFYEIKFENKGGLVMPLIVEFTFADGTTSTERIAAQIWRKDENTVTKVFVMDKEVKSIQLDPHRETADIDTSNNSWPELATPSRFQIFKGGSQGRNRSSGAPTPMSRESRR